MQGSGLAVGWWKGCSCRRWRKEALTFQRTLGELTHTQVNTHIRAYGPPTDTHTHMETHTWTHTCIHAYRPHTYTYTQRETHRHTTHTHAHTRVPLPLATVLVKGPDEVMSTDQALS